jgi:uncharacterized membrane protein
LSKVTKPTIFNKIVMARVMIIYVNFCGESKHTPIGECIISEVQSRITLPEVKQKEAKGSFTPHSLSGP